MDKRVEIFKGYVCDIDSLNFTLKKDVKIVKDKKGKEVEVSKIVGYYNNWEGIFKGIKRDYGLSLMKVSGTLEDVLKVNLMVLDEIRAISKRIEGER